MQKKNYAVVGSGAAGIAAAYFLHKHGFNVELIEKETDLGGRIRPFKMGDRWIQLGGKNIGKKYTLFREFTAAVGNFSYEYFGLNSSQVRNGKILTIDGKNRLRSAAQLLKCGSWQDVIRFLQMGAAISRNPNNGYLGGPYFKSLGRRFNNISLDRYFTPEFCKTVIRPMSVRMNGAEPDEVYIGNFGSNLRMLFDSYEQLSDGMGAVLSSFAQKICVRTSTQVEGLVVQGGRISGLRVRDKDGVWEREYDGVILATQAPIAAKLVQPHANLLAKALEGVSYYPVKVIVAEYKRNIFSEKVRALVFDDDQVISNAGVYGVNDRHIIRFTFSGRTARQYLEANTDEEKLLTIAEQTLNRYIPVEASERVQFVSKGYSLGLCAYTQNYEDFSTSLNSQLEKLPGLYLTGDYMQGASIEACFRSSQACVNQILKLEQAQTQDQAEVTAQIAVGASR